MIRHSRRGMLINMCINVNVCALCRLEMRFCRLNYPKANTERYDWLHVVNKSPVLEIFKAQMYFPFEIVFIELCL